MKIPEIKLTPSEAVAFRRAIRKEFPLIRLRSFLMDVAFIARSFGYELRPWVKRFTHAR